MRTAEQSALELFERRHAFPDEPLFRLMVDEGVAGGVLEFGCRSGLFAHRLSQAFDVDVIGVDRDAAAIAAGRGAGLSARLYAVHVDLMTLGFLVEKVEEYGCKTLVARRSLHALFSAGMRQAQFRRVHATLRRAPREGLDEPFAALFIERMVGAGIEQVFIETDAYDLPADAEMSYERAPFFDRFDARVADGGLAHLGAGQRC